MIAETNGTDTIYYTYDTDGKLISITLNDVEYFYVTNILGDITHLLDSSGNEVVSYEYDAWGNITKVEDTSGVNLAEKNSYRYRGYRYDEETGYYYLQSRYYNPEIRRFISADGLIGREGDPLGYNMYAYASNNPVMMYDPTGYIAWAIPGAIIGGVVGGIAGAAVSYYTTGEVDWRYVAGGAVAGALVGAGAGYLAQTAIASTTAGAGGTSTTIGGAVTADGDATNEVKTAIQVGDKFANGKFTYVGQRAASWLSSRLHAGQRMAQRNVSTKEVYTTIKNGHAFSQWGGERYAYISPRATVIIDKGGQVVTVMGRQDYREGLQEIVRVLFGG
ncbi:RHS repeat-associated core domain-containing protein [Haloplasma contractile]|uniref:Wall-associated protein n=1 Tax=Haloplasma contractile SSD-17B TaxID=1033810 RepID=U2EF42_9MOLU|nr:RHS repeat-associated core domain-containing protein [Haloplasma contractile]ERJ13306.1 Wall-associated protein [Haloplasma contractile SSD-17B]